VVQLSNDLNACTSCRSWFRQQNLEPIVTDSVSKVDPRMLEFLILKHTARPARTMPAALELDRRKPIT